MSQLTKTVITSLSIILSVVTLSAHATQICEGTSNRGSTTKAIIKKDSVHFEVTNADGSSYAKDFTNINSAWDGHTTGLITAPALSIKFEWADSPVFDDVDIVFQGNEWIETVYVYKCTLQVE